MSTHETPASEKPAQKYRLAMYGGGIEELDRFGLRDRIRSGEVGELTELALAGTDEWRPASSYPELKRYLDIAATSGQRLAAPPGTAPKPPRTLQPMGQRILHGITYPLAGGEIITLLGLSILNIIPFVSILSTLASTLIMITIIRRSADGYTRMPPLTDMSNIPEMIRLYLRVLFVTLVSLAPVLVVLGYSVYALILGKLAIPFAVAGLVVALAVAAIYYPACLATIAVWDDMLSALNPVYVFRVISLIGADYFIVIGMWFVATLVSSVARFPQISPLASIPIVGGIMGAFLSYWALFYASHLLGFAVYRHAEELGWD